MAEKNPEIVNLQKIFIPLLLLSLAACSLQPEPPTRQSQEEFTAQVASIFESLTIKFVGKSNVNAD